MKCRKHTGLAALILICMAAGAALAACAHVTPSENVNSMPDSAYVSDAESPEAAYVFDADVGSPETAYVSDIEADTSDESENNADETNSDAENEAQEDAPAGMGFAPVWVVEPTLEYEHIVLCNCGLFHDRDDWAVIDPVTGSLTGKNKLSHSGPGPDFVYDRWRVLFGQPSYGNGLVGMLTLSEFEAMGGWLLVQSSGLIAVQSVDWFLKQYLREIEYTHPDFHDYWSLVDEAFSGQFAVMYNRQIVTDFVFDGGAHWWYRFSYVDEGFGRENLGFIAMRKNGQWGLVDRMGRTVLPFIFDDLLVISQSTAFARIDGGMYGILDLTATMDRWN